MRKSRKGNPPKTFGQCGSVWLGCILLRAEEILKSKYLHEMHLQWVVGSTVCLVCSCPLYPMLVPSHRSVLHTHTHFPWAQVGE